MIFEEIPAILRSLLFICRCDFRLTPNERIAPALEPGAFRWRATGPGSEVGVKIWRPTAGWVLARMNLVDGFRQVPELKIHFTGGRRTGPEATLYLVPAGHDGYQALGFIPFPVKSVRFDPGKWEGDFIIREFALYNVPRLFVRRIGIQALSAYHPEFRGEPAAKIRGQLLDQSNESKKGVDEILEEHILSLIEPDDRASYETWIRRVEEAEIARHREMSSNLAAACACRPLISILLPVGSTPNKFLAECLDSVRAQCYPNWELCIACDRSSSEASDLIDSCAQRDKRIRVNAGIPPGSLSRAMNAALEMAGGDYVALLSPGDTLAPDALLSVVETLQTEPRPKIVYSDEDQIDEKGRRHSPHFKCGWNPDLLYSRNYVSRLCVYEAGLVRSSGGFREGFEGGEEYDLLLRTSGQVGEERIGHLPAVLYHRRENAPAGAGESNTTRTAWDSGIRALQSFFNSRGNGVRIERGPEPFSYRAEWPLPDPTPLVSIIIPTRDNHRLLRSCLASVLEKTGYPRFEILVIDNESRDPATLAYLDEISADKRIQVLQYPGPFNYSAINNFGVSEAKGDILCLLNDDVEVIERDWLREMVSHACRQEIGCVGAKLIYPDGTIQHGGVICGIGGIAGHSHRHFMREDRGYFSRLTVAQNLSAVTAACLVARREVWEQAGGMNSKDLPVAYNDVDFCLRVRRQGLRILWTPYALMSHMESASRGPEMRRDDQDRVAKEKTYMRETWGELLDHDLYYSPHLTLRREDFSIRVAR